MATRFGLGLLLLAGLLLPAQAQVLPSFGGDRAGTSGFQFLKIPVDARSAALGQTVVANAFDGSALFWNPALAASLPGFHVAFQHTAYFVDTRMEFVGATYRLGGSGLTFGLSLQAFDAGEMDVTTEFAPFGTGETFGYSTFATGLTVAQELTDLFSYGITGKWVREQTAGVSTNTAVFDLGFFYRIGTTGAQMAVAIRNFGLDGTPSGDLNRLVIGEGTSTVPVDDFESITPPTTFLLGFTYNPLQNNSQNDLLISAQLSNPNDNAENWNVGAEYIWNDLLALRAGYRFGIDEVRLPSFGFGVFAPFLGPRIRVDYGFTNQDRLGTIHRIGLDVGFGG